MKIILQPTGEFEHVNGVPCRIWNGTTEDGDEVRAFVAMVRCRAGSSGEAAFNAALRAVEPERQAVIFDNRFAV